MNETIIKEIANSLSITEKQVSTVLQLLEEDNTIPFIARYRKEATGALDEENGKKIMNVFHELHKKGNTLIIVTHDPSVAAQCSRTICIKDGKVCGTE